MRSVALLMCANLVDSWEMPQSRDCPAEKELIVRYTKGLDERGSDAFRLTLLSTSPYSDVKRDDQALNMSFPRRIELNTELTTNWEVLANWSSLWYRSSTFDVSQSSEVRLNTSCGESKLHLRNPGRGQGHVSMVFGDPYYGKDRPAVYTNISKQLPNMINNLAQFDSVHSLGVLGDFWYELSPMDVLDFNRHLSLQAKSLMTYSVLGNHDHWVGGHPLNDKDSQQGYSMKDYAHGYGWTQFWAQDTIGVFENERQGRDAYHEESFMKTDSKPYEDFAYTQGTPIHAVPRKFSSSYFVHGNMGYILMSGLWTFEDQKEWIAGACKAMERDDVTSIWLVGHWSEDIHNPKSEGYNNHAAGADLSIRRLFDHVASGDLGGNSPCYRAYAVGQLKFLNGHDHWNDCVKEQVVELDGAITTVCAGWQVAGMGKGEGTLDATLPPNQTTISCPQCDLGEFTLATLDTRQDTLRMGFMHMVTNMTDRTDEWNDCFKQMGSDFSFDFVLSSCQKKSSAPLVHLWSQPLRKLFATPAPALVV